MEESPLRSTLTRTSTPRCSFIDSGYFGSDAKSSSRNSFHKLSPVKESPHDMLRVSSLLNIDELSPLKFNRSNTSHKFYFETEHKYSINKQLSYDDSSFTSVSLSSECESATGVFPYESSYEWFHPQFTFDVSPQKGFSVPKPFLPSIFNVLPKVDILAVLKKKQCQHVIANLLSFIPAEDLCRMNCVSKTWKELIVKDVKANGRRREYLKKVKAQRENRMRLQLSQFDLRKRYEHLSQLPKMILKDINKSYPDIKIESTKDSSSKFESFVTAGKSQFNGSLMKCPRCSYASKMINVHKYICTDCYYIFCKKCLFQYENDHSCPAPSNAKRIDIIGSKKSKKNLRRL